MDDDDAHDDDNPPQPPLAGPSAPRTPHRDRKSKSSLTDDVRSPPGKRSRSTKAANAAHALAKKTKVATTKAEGKRVRTSGTGASGGGRVLGSKGYTINGIVLLLKLARERLPLCKPHWGPLAIDYNNEAESSTLNIAFRDGDSLRRKFEGVSGLSLMFRMCCSHLSCFSFRWRSRRQESTR